MYIFENVTLDSLTLFDYWGKFAFCLVGPSARFGRRRTTRFSEGRSQHLAGRVVPHLGEIPVPLVTSHRDWFLKTVLLSDWRKTSFLPDLGPLTGRRAGFLSHRG